MEIELSDAKMYGKAITRISDPACQDVKLTDNELTDLRMLVELVSAFCTSAELHMISAKFAQLDAQLHKIECKRVAARKA